MKILFVCSSNVCRSPYCEFHFKRLMEEYPALKEMVTECNSGAVFNRSKKLHDKAKKALLTEGFSESVIDGHKPRYLHDQLSLFKDSDVIIGMTRWHKWCLPKELRSKYVNLSEVAGENYKAIPDPFLAVNQTEYNKVMAVVQDYVKKYALRLIGESNGR